VAEGEAAAPAEEAKPAAAPKAARKSSKKKLGEGAAA